MSRLPLSVLWTLPFIAGVLIQLGVDSSGPGIKIALALFILICLSSASLWGVSALGVLSVGGSSSVLLILVLASLFIILNYSHVLRRSGTVAALSTAAVAIFAGGYFSAIWVGGYGNASWVVSRTSFAVAPIAFLYGTLLEIDWAGISARRIVLALLLAHLGTVSLGLVYAESIRIRSLVGILFLTAAFSRPIIRRALKGDLVLVAVVTYALLLLSRVLAAHLLMALLLGVGATWALHGRRRRLARYVPGLLSLFGLGATSALALGTQIAENNLLAPVRPGSTFDGGWLPYLQAKLFADRLPIWSGVLSTHLPVLDHAFPPIEPALIPIVFPGRSTLEVGYGAHHLPLELVRQLGWMLGSVVTIVWLTRVSRLGVAIAKVPSQGLRVMACGLIGLSLAVGFSGQWLLMPNAAFVYGALVGSVAAARPMAKPL